MPPLLTPSENHQHSISVPCACSITDFANQSGGCATLGF